MQKNGSSQMEFYNSKKWERKRAAVLRRDGYMCRQSKRYGKRIPATTVHHIFPREHFPEYSLAGWNLISLCAEEHNKMHDRATHELTEYGMELLRRTARQQGIELEESE